MSEQCSFGAVSEHFSLIGILSDFIILSTAVKVQFQCTFRAVAERFRIAKVQFWSSFRAIFIDWDIVWSHRFINGGQSAVSEQFQCTFSAVPERFQTAKMQFQSGYRAISALFESRFCKICTVQFQSSSSAHLVQFQNDFRLLKCSFGAVTEQFQRCLRADSAKPAQCSFRAFPAHIQCSFRAATAPLLAFQNENGDSDKQKCTSPAVPVEFQSSFNGGHESLTG